MDPSSACPQWARDHELGFGAVQTLDLDFDRIDVDLDVLGKDLRNLGAQVLQLAPVEPAAVVGQDQVQTALGLLAARDPAYEQTLDLIPHCHLLMPVRAREPVP